MQRALALAVLAAAVAAIAAAPVIVSKKPTDADMKKMQDEYWVAKAGPASDLTNLKIPSDADMKKMQDEYWVAKAGPASDLSKLKPSDADMKKMQDEYWVAKAGPASDLTQMKPSDADMKKMQDEYWVAKAGPASDLNKLQKKNTTAKTVEGTFRLSYGGTPMGLLSGEDYLAGGRQMEQFGFAKVFGADKEEMVTFLNKNSKHHIPNYNSLVSCAQSTGCPYAWKTDPELKGKNTTVVSVITTLPGSSTVRCHDHATGSWCHELTEEFNKGTFYVLWVRADDEPELVRVGLAMCHQWPKQFESGELKTCHSMPEGLVVPIAGAPGSPP